MFFLSSFHPIFPWIFDACGERFGLHFGILLAPASSKKPIRIADRPFGGPLVRLGSLLSPFWAFRGPIWLRVFPFWLPFRSKSFPFRHPIRKAPADYRMHPRFYMHPTFPRPGAGILPQAIEIRSGPLATGRVGIQEQRVPYLEGYLLRRLPS